ncbi:Reducing polyketide synthase rdc5 [Lasiodiplodia theobromae]|uniref:Reducing polyketide synthase rdc5 n=1 Tax=Lasiodiplodia theobromae TaxID=45133 RepID=A0A5N5D4V4_9PEZI|nr:Reducing polyketide synthase rdc5 [Lasiodiplodia theobromae]
MRPPGGMFIDADPADFDAPFFGISKVDAIAMDPQQRQILEVVYEGLENAGITLQDLDGAPLVGLDVACRYLSTGEINGAIVGASQLFLSPEHVMDTGTMKAAHSPSGKCHTFDVKADGYIKAEAVNVVILKRLSDAIRDQDPIRAVIRGSATNSDGNTPGIASPSAAAQSRAIRSAYANAGISDLNQTLYLECHGTGTQAGDPIEVSGVADVFAALRPDDMPLIIGSIKSNVGHSEPAAGLSGLLKAVLALEHDFIPGNPTFETPNPKIDMKALKVRASKANIPWPKAQIKRASVNSFGYGGSNAHVVVDDAYSALKRADLPHTRSIVTDYDDLFADDGNESPRQLLVFSGNDEASLKANVAALSSHLLNPGVRADLRDLAYTLAERRTHHFYRAFAVAESSEYDEGSVVFGKKQSTKPTIGFVFTGQGAQWPHMGRGLVEMFPSASETIKRLDSALQTLPDPPKWTILDELTESRTDDHMRLPEFSQPLVTALQLVLLDIFKSWGIRAHSVVGHSSGEIAAACAAGLLTKEDAIKIAYFRGKAATDCFDPKAPAVGMMAVGLGAESVRPYLADLDVEKSVQIACFNSPDSVTLSGQVSDLERVQSRLKEESIFARLLKVNMAYHSTYMNEVGNHYRTLVQRSCGRPLGGDAKVTMFSSVTGERMAQAADADYWTANMVSPVRFAQACKEMISNGPDAADFLIELGPSGALKGPISQIKKALVGQGSDTKYQAALARGDDSTNALFSSAGQLFIAGADIAIGRVNRSVYTDNAQPQVIVDLPNYAWNHSTKYWQESQASKDWRFRRFPHHDLLGSKVLGTSWTNSPTWKNILRLNDLPWLKDHKMGSDTLLPASGFVAMAIEAMYQLKQSVDPVEGVNSVSDLSYRLRDTKFDKALVLEEGVGVEVKLSLTPHPGTKNSWYRFTVSTLRDDVETEHSTGLIMVQGAVDERATESDLKPLQHSTSGRLWYKAVNEIGYGFGPSFQKQIAVEARVGQRQSRSTVSLTEPPAAHSPQSQYLMHPASMDGCFQTLTPSLWAGDRVALNAVLVPAIVDELIVAASTSKPETAISVTTSEYTGRGRPEEAKSYASSCSVFDPNTSALLLKVKGLKYHKLDDGAEPNAGQTYCRSVWKPDVTFLHESQLLNVLSDGETPKVHQIIDLVAHKKPNLRVAEVDVASTDSIKAPKLWFNGGDQSARAAYTEFFFSTNNAKCLLDAQAQYQKERNCSFGLSDITKPDFAAPEAKFDFVVLTVADLGTLASAIDGASKMLARGGQLLVIGRGALDNQHTAAVQLVEAAKAIRGGGFGDVIPLPAEGADFAFLSTLPSLPDGAVSEPLNIVQLCSSNDTIENVERSLAASGLQTQSHTAPFSSVAPRSTVLVLDELVQPVLATATGSQWEALKHLISIGCRVLWVTYGSQHLVTHPTNALVHGLFRTIRAEDPGARLTTLDVAADTSAADIASTIVRVLAAMDAQADQKLHIEHEYCERGGVVYANRILPDAGVNDFKDHEEVGSGLAPVMRRLRDLNVTARLRAERIGTLDALTFAEVAREEAPVAEGKVEVEIFAVGLNFKDVAVSMGIVPENEHILGYEGAGVVRRIGKGVTGFQPGDRVAVCANGCFANRNEIWQEQVHRLPSWLSFQDAATITLVYSTSMHALLDLGGLRKGQIYATVGTDEKRRFLTEQFGVPSDHIFSSRTPEFATKIRDATNGRGIDVILNSLTGELLDASWRLCADGGTMIEIGKRDIVDRNYLAMEPFDRNCSYRALDYSFKAMTLPMISDLLSRIFRLVEEGHLKPIRPVTTFKFDSIASAFALIRSGRHMGKIVVTDGEDANPELPVRPARRELVLKPNASYLIVGGLKGLCGSLAIHLARSGAKHIVALSRSGCKDDVSQGIIHQCRSLGCEVQEAIADICNEEDVIRVFQQASPPIGGVIQGAMVLKDKPYETMTLDEYHAVIASKVQGTWSLHKASLQSATPLDFFTLLSSISGLEGKKGQANYAAGNAFLDAFSAYRNAQGLAANAVNLGVIEDVGYIFEQGGMEQHFDRRHWTYINEVILRRILGYSIMQQGSTPLNGYSVSQLITGIAVPQPADSDNSRDARFAAMFVGDGGDAASGGANAKAGADQDLQEFFLLHRSGADPSLVLKSVIEVVNKRFMKILGLDQPLEPGKPLAAYGLDSLSAVEFRNWLRADVGAELTMLEITNASSLVKLCEKIVAKVATN